MEEAVAAGSETPRGGATWRLGSATVVGGEGADAALTRYDLTTARADNGRASVTLVLTAAGTVTVEAKVKPCGGDGIGPTAARCCWPNR